jgi:hypothetical protein
MRPDHRNFFQSLLIDWRHQSRRLRLSKLHVFHKTRTEYVFVEHFQSSQVLRGRTILCPTGDFRLMWRVRFD